MKAGGKRLFPVLILVLLLLTLLLTSCSLPGQQASPPVKRIHISGLIYGADIVAAMAGRVAPPQHIAAHVRCNESAGVADVYGHYMLAVRQADTYRCAVSYPGYADGKVVISAAPPQQAIAVNFGPVGSTSCDPATFSTTTTTITCSPLNPTQGTLTGAVTRADSHSPLANATVECWSNIDQPQLTNLTLATTDARGHYTLPSAAIGPNDCTILGKDDIYAAIVNGSKTTTLDMQVCQNRCGTFHYHGGSVMESFRAYLIFWLPPEFSYEPYGSSARFESLISRYFSDVGGSALYGLLTQYWGLQGQIHNRAELGGVYRDTRPYPASGTRSHPLVDSDITAEIGRVMKLNGWSEAPTNEFFVITGFNVQECFLANHRDGCSFYTGHDDYCAYHDHSGGLIYAYVSVSNFCVSLPGNSPNGDTIADRAISVISHEQFESVTDPLIDGWYGGTVQESEVADICQEHYGQLRADGSNVTLSNGHRYIVQEEWSRRASRCTLS
jgi:phosphate-induced protein 1